MPEDTLSKYKILARLSSEPDGIFYEAESPSSGERVFLKILPWHLRADAEVVKRFHSAAVLAKVLDHPSILRVLDHGEEKGFHFIVMEFCPGTRLNEILFVMGPFPWKKAVNTILPIVAALRTAHIAGIVHGNLCPRNIFVNEENQVKMCDFGTWPLVHYLVREKQAKPEEFTRYAAPEQEAGDSELDGRSDLYSLGVILYEMLTARLPTAAEATTPVGAQRLKPPRELDSEIPSELDAIVLKLLRKQPEQRYRNCKELIDALDVLVGNEKPAAAAMPSGRVFGRQQTLTTIMQWIRKSWSQFKRRWPTVGRMR